MIKASFDAWMNAEYWIGGPKGVDFSTRYTKEELELMRSSFRVGSGDSPGFTFSGAPNENMNYLIDWSFSMGRLFTKRLQEKSKTLKQIKDEAYVDLTVDNIQIKEEQFNKELQDDELQHYDKEAFYDQYEK